MAKAGKGGKGGKKGKGKKAKKKEENPALLTEVDKTFYELQITDLNRKLARLRSLTQELEEKNEELTQNNQKLDEDRADVIAYLKRSLQEKADEINDLQERLKGLQEKRQAEVEEFQEKIMELQHEYQQMQETLSSEIKLLTGKLNSLEEFRIQRDELMRKYEVQETAMQEQEIRHKREVYNIEKKFIIGKDKLKKDMEMRLLQLSSEFQDATNLRIAATTHRVIRENIAINNELDVILETHHRLQVENETLKERDKVLTMETELRESEKNKALAKSQVQYKLIEKLTADHVVLNKKMDNYKEMEKKILSQRKELRDADQSNENLSYKIRVLEQNLHASRCDRARMKLDLEFQQNETLRLGDILVEAVMSIEDALRLDDDQDAAKVLSKRETLLCNLLKLLSKVHDQTTKQVSIDSVGSCSAIYAKGDLGFVPKAIQLRTQIPTRRNMDTQVGSSFEDFLSNRSDTVVERLKDFLGEEEEVVGDEQSGMAEEVEAAEEEQSQVFFDSEPETLSVSEEAPVEVEFSKSTTRAAEQSEETAEPKTEETTAPSGEGEQFKEGEATEAEEQDPGETEDDEEA